MKKKAPKTKGCLCKSRKPLHPISNHSASCPVSRRFTVNGRIIADLMHSEKMRGNAKDYVILSGSTLLDFNGTFDMQQDKGTLSVPKVCLVHKRKLHNIIGEEQAARFWRPGFGRVKHGN